MTVRKRAIVSGMLKVTLLLMRLNKNCVRMEGTAPSGANHQPWYFVAISDAQFKQQVRVAAEEEEKKFYEGGGSDEWIKALESLWTGAEKPHLMITL